MALKFLDSVGEIDFPRLPWDLDATELDVSATDRLVGRVTPGAGKAEEVACTAAGRALLDDADAAAQRDTIGVPHEVRLGGDIANSTTSLADVTGLGISMVANGEYLFELYGAYDTSNAANGIWLSANGPASPTRVSGTVWAGGGLPVKALTGYEAGTAFATAPFTTDNPIRMDMLVVNGANAGTWIPRFANETAANTVTFKAGSILRWRRTA